MGAATEAVTIRTINPANEHPLESYAQDDRAAVDAKLNGAIEAFPQWRALGFDGRATILRRVASVLRERKLEFGTLITNEMGKPLTESEAEVEKCAWCCEYFAANASAMLADEQIVSGATESYVAFHPLGSILAVMPWNFPFWQVFRFAAPSMMAGNVAVLKHAANVTGCGLAIARIFASCGAPGGAFSTLVVRSDRMASIVQDDRIAAVTLTGSGEAGSAVASAAGRSIKKTVLELGGSDAFIVLADSDLDAAAEMAVRARFQNTGQSCIAAKRFIVEEPVYDEFLQRFVARTQALVAGDPLERSTQIGPLARSDLRDALDRQVTESVRRGARLLLGGVRLARPGYYYAPTIVADVDAAMPASSEETFGPAAAVFRARDADDAIALANDSRFGLGGNLWTRDIARARSIAARLESGSVFINGMTASDPRLPFGGMKQSGYGRELSHYGIKEFVNIQTVWIGPPRAF